MPRLPANTLFIACWEGKLETELRRPPHQPLAALGEGEALLDGAAVSTALDEVDRIAGGVLAISRRCHEAGPQRRHRVAIAGARAEHPALVLDRAEAGDGTQRDSIARAAASKRSTSNTASRAIEQPGRLGTGSSSAVTVSP